MASFLFVLNSFAVQVEVRWSMWVCIFLHNCLPIYLHIYIVSIWSSHITHKQSLAIKRGDSHPWLRSPTFYCIHIWRIRRLQLWTWGCESFWKAQNGVHKVRRVRGEWGPRMRFRRRRNACHWGATYFTPY